MKNTKITKNWETCKEIDNKLIMYSRLMLMLHFLSSLLSCLPAYLLHELLACLFPYLPVYLQSVKDVSTCNHCQPVSAMSADDLDR